ncbi:DUF6221 family protein [Streptomonospora litoralis]|uniref:Uncharacterized protein n=1 Tax=Streptomonospora litoralis TaxID=2498135 RepID=A0A4P6Q7Q7_9ACTN|nr:DUF6221 family protein [Streptomonospora litoralis]QBI56753.1 hypothetical protein EKD16_25060 [Streptomonospora litoralis]
MEELIEFLRMRYEEDDRTIERGRSTRLGPDQAADLLRNYDNKRAVLNAHAPQPGDADGNRIRACGVCSNSGALCPAVLHLAQDYQWHPLFNPVWAS